MHKSRSACIHTITYCCIALSAFTAMEYPEISAKILQALRRLANVPVQQQLDLKARAIAGVGENSYGLVLQVSMKTPATATTPTSSAPAAVERSYILKIAPKNPARRSHMRVADYYAREVYMYDVVFPAYRKLTAADDCCLDLMPTMLHYSLDECDEFIIFEDLTQSNYTAGRRTQLPDYEMAAMALRSLGRFHALAFALQAKDNDAFSALIAKLQPDNLFTPDIEPLSIEFGKSYIRRALHMIQGDEDTTEGDSVASCAVIEALGSVERNFKDICLYCVNGCACAPYAVICHGDFWNNNILFKYDSSNNVTSAKLIDFQMSRYASPILDLVHYLFICTTSDLRAAHFERLLYDVYYETLGRELQNFKLDISRIYPRAVFAHQLRSYGIYGLCMAAFSLPFFVADTTELPDLDRVSEAICDISTSANDSTRTLQQNEDEPDDNKDLKRSQLKLIEEDFNLLTSRTAPIFKARMAGIVADIVKYDIKTDVGSTSI